MSLNQSLRQQVFEFNKKNYQIIYVFVEHKHQIVVLTDKLYAIQSDMITKLNKRIS